MGRFHLKMLRILLNNYKNACNITNVVLPTQQQHGSIKAQV